MTARRVRFLVAALVVSVLLSPALVFPYTKLEGEYLRRTTLCPPALLLGVSCACSRHHGHRVAAAGHIE